MTTIETISLTCTFQLVDFSANTIEVHYLNIEYVQVQAFEFLIDKLKYALKSTQNPVIIIKTKLFLVLFK